MISTLIDLRRAHQAIAQARDKAAICEALQRLAGADGRLRGVSNLALGAGVAAAALALGVALWLRWPQAIAAAAAVAALVLPLLAFAWRRRRTIVAAALERAVFLDEGLNAQAVDATATWREWRRAFADFRRGDKLQGIDTLFEGCVRLGDGPAAYRCYRFAYVEAEGRQAGTGGQAQPGTGREVLHHRHGVLVELKQPAGLALSTVRRPDLPHRWSSAMPEFDARFKVGSQHEQTPDLVLTPRVLGLVCALAEHFTGLDIELRGAAGACISFDNDDLLQPDPAALAFDDAVDVLIGRIQRTQGLPRLRRLLTLVQALAAAGAALPPAPRPVGAALVRA